MLYLLKKDKALLPKIIQDLESQEKDVMVEILPPTRSKAQNRLFHANIAIIGDKQGYTIDEIKSFIKKSITESGKLRMMYRKGTKKMDVEVYISTAKLNKPDFAILMEYVYLLGETLELRMKYPDDLGLDKDFLTK